MFCTSGLVVGPVGGSNGVAAAGCVCVPGVGLTLSVGLTLAMFCCVSFAGIFHSINNKWEEFSVLTRVVKRGKIRGMEVSAAGGALFHFGELAAGPQAQLREE